MVAVAEVAAAVFGGKGRGGAGSGVRNLRRAASLGVLSLERGRELGEAERGRGGVEMQAEIAQRKKSEEKLSD